MKSKILFHFLFVLMTACSITAQVKKQLTEDDYKLWSTMEAEQMSEKGSWISYSLRYESGIDTLYVKNTTTLKSYVFDEGVIGLFATDNFFIVRTTNGDIVLTDLRSGNERRYPKISNFATALGGKMLIMLKSDGVVAGDLLIVDVAGTDMIKLPEVSLYSLSPDKNKLVCDSKGKVHLLDLKKMHSVQQIDPTERSYNSFAWQNNGLSFAWIAGDDLGTVGQYRLKDNKVYIFDRSKFSNFPRPAEIYNGSGNKLSISDDGERVFFGVKGKRSVVDPTGVQVWNAADKVLYPNRAASQDWTDGLTFALWFPAKQMFRMVTNNQFPSQILIPGQKYALVYNPLDNEPQFDRDALVNYYLQNVTTGQQQLLLANHSSDIEKIGVSNTGKYITYFKDKQWWVYDILSGLHRDLTSQTKKTFTQDKYDRSGEQKVSGIAGWTGNDTELIIYDNYDIWLLKIDGSSAVRLTKGREQGIVYRVVSQSPFGQRGSAGNGVLNLNRGLLLEAVSDKKSGYCTWSAKSGLEQIVFENNRIGWLKHSENGAYSYIRENYDLSPQLVFQFRDNKSKVLYQSNSQHKNYGWGSSRLISYKNSRDQPLNGALFYPAGYNSDKSYPMIVHIYERQSDYYNQYVNPTLLNSEGFNISNLTTQGYFVLLPDIAYEEGQTGSSAVDCVVRAVNEVLAHEAVDPKRLGLIGHSFGGYETNFIITQTNKFAAAISGAGVSDIVSSYVTVGRGNMKPDGWRYEFDQFRIGTSLFDGFQKYLQNSPITFAAQVSTPLLLWSGELDMSINYYQSLEFHLALRRLQKPNIFLLYEKGGHSVMKKEDRTDLTHRTQEWFDYYLKGGIKPEWFTPDKI